MKAFNQIVKWLLALFFIICLAVHVYGLIYHNYPEPNWSHIVHLISYGLCLYVMLARVQNALALYSLGAAYPFFYHARCLLNHYSAEHSIVGVCALVVVLLPAGLAWIGYSAPAKS